MEGVLVLEMHLGSLRGNVLGNCSDFFLQPYKLYRYSLAKLTMVVSMILHGIATRYNGSSGGR